MVLGFYQVLDSPATAQEFRIGVDPLTYGGAIVSEIELLSGAAPVPEPSSILLLGSGLLAMAGALKKITRKKHPAI